MTCRICQKDTPTAYAEFNQNTGLLFRRYHKQVKGNLCRECLKRVFLSFTLHNLFLGWWGTISFFATIFFTFGNVFYFLRGLWLTRAVLVPMPLDRPTPDYQPFNDVR